MKITPLHRALDAKITKEYAKLSDAQKAKLNPKSREIAEKARKERNDRLEKKKR